MSDPSPIARDHDVLPFVDAAQMARWDEHGVAVALDDRRARELVSRAQERAAEHRALDPSTFGAEVQLARPRVGPRCRTLAPRLAVRTERGLLGPCDAVH